MRVSCQVDKQLIHSDVRPPQDSTRAGEAGVYMWRMTPVETFTTYAQIVSVSRSYNGMDGQSIIGPGPILTPSFGLLAQVSHFPDPDFICITQSILNGKSRISFVSTSTNLVLPTPRKRRWKYREHHDHKSYWNKALPGPAPLTTSCDTALQNSRRGL